MRAWTGWQVALGLIMALGPGRGRRDVVGGEWLVTRVSVGPPGSEGGPAPVMGDAGSDGNAINAGTAGVAGSAGKAGGDGEPGTLGC